MTNANDYPANYVKSMEHRVGIIDEKINYFHQATRTMPKEPAMQLSAMIDDIEAKKTSLENKIIRTKKSE
jgi:hypothetical protein